MEDVWLERCKQAIVQNSERLPDMEARLFFAVGYLEFHNKEITELLELIVGRSISDIYEHSE